MSQYTLKKKIGCWVHERWRAEVIVCTPRLAHALGWSWMDLCNRNERLLRDAATGGRQCDWENSTALKVTRIFPDLGSRLLQECLSRWPINLHPDRKLQAVNTYDRHAVKRINMAMADSWKQQLTSAEIDQFREIWDRFDVPLYRADSEWTQTVDAADASDSRQ